MWLTAGACAKSGALRATRSSDQPRPDRCHAEGRRHHGTGGASTGLTSQVGGAIAKLGDKVPGSQTAGVTGALGTTVANVGPPMSTMGGTASPSAAIGGLTSGVGVGATTGLSATPSGISAGAGADVAAGDRGWGASAEPNRLFRFGGAWLNQVEPLLLVEVAEVSDMDGTSTPSPLRSVALGVGLSDARRYTLDLAVAKPTGDPTSNEPATQAARRPTS